MVIRVYWDEDEPTRNSNILLSLYFFSASVSPVARLNKHHNSVKNTKIISKHMSASLLGYINYYL